MSVPPPRNRPIKPTQNVGTVVPAVVDVPEVKNEELKLWVDNLYDVSKVTEEEISTMWTNFSYRGFIREDVLKQLHAKIKDRRICIELIVVGALRGPQAAARIKLSNGKTPVEMGIPASGGQGSKILTMNKIQSATADLAAFFLKKMNIPKRLNVDLPAWLQFPSAGSIQLPESIREQHLEFSRKFSSLIGGEFQENIYSQMRQNAYLDPKLKLFA